MKKLASAIVALIFMITLPIISLADNNGQLLLETYINVRNKYDGSHVRDLSGLMIGQPVLLKAQYLSLRLKVTNNSSFSASVTVECTIDDTYNYRFEQRSIGARSFTSAWLPYSEELNSVMVIGEHQVRWLINGEMQLIDRFVITDLPEIELLAISEETAEQPQQAVLTSSLPNHGQFTDHKMSMEVLCAEREDDGSVTVRDVLKAEEFRQIDDIMAENSRWGIKVLFSFPMASRTQTYDLTLYMVTPDEQVYEIYQHKMRVNSGQHDAFIRFIPIEDTIGLLQNEKQGEAPEIAGYYSIYAYMNNQQACIAEFKISQ